MNPNSDYEKNTVDPRNQVKNNGVLLGDTNNKNAFRIAFLGNSITYHESKPEIGWNFNHGMAASKPENDYVHQLITKIENNNNKKVVSLVINGASFEVDYSNNEILDNLVLSIRNFEPDLIVFKLGENVRYSEENDATLIKQFSILIERLLKVSSNLVMVSLFWPHEKLENVLEQAARNNSIKIVNILDLGMDDKFKAIGLFNHEGVSIHPGDLGMKEIANRIYNSLNIE